MTVLITLTTAGTDSGPFNLYSNVDGYTIPFETNVNKAALQAGYSSALVPDYATTIRVVSVGNCVNYIDILLTSPTSSTTSTSSTSTTSSSSTTTTSTTAVPIFNFSLSTPFSTLTDACNLAITYPYPVHSTDNPLIIGSLVKDLLENPFPGGGNWYKINLSLQAVQINGSGIVIASGSC